MPRGRALDLTGQRFGRWTVVEKAGRTERLKVLWLCRCECGEKVVVRADNLTSKKSSGCRDCYLKHRS